MPERLRVVRRFRSKLATSSREIIAAIDRDPAEILASELIPLADAARYLELCAPRLLAPRRVSKVGRPVWLKRVRLMVRREPLGVVLLIGPSNYPLSLLGVQALQALVAGNAVLWKPGANGRPAALAMQKLLSESGLPNQLFTVLDSSAEAAQDVIAAGVDKVFLTGSLKSGQSVLSQCAHTVTPSSLELSGCDAFFVLPGADVDRAARALAFGLVFNGGATCIAPRRVFVHAEIEREFIDRLKSVIADVERVSISPRIASELSDLLDDAEKKGAIPLFPSDRKPMYSMLPLVVTNATPDMKLMSADIFAPVAAVSVFNSFASAVESCNSCPYALGASVFGPEEEAQRFGNRLRAGIVIVNDVIVPTADPRLSFGGRDSSGFGRTRGEEGLLEMTVTKSVVTQGAKRPRHLEPRHSKLNQILEFYLQVVHGSFATKVRAISDLWRAASGKQGINE